VQRLEDIARGGGLERSAPPTAQHSPRDKVTPPPRPARGSNKSSEAGGAFERRRPTLQMFLLAQNISTEWPSRTVSWHSHAATAPLAASLPRRPSASGHVGGMTSWRVVEPSTPTRLWPTFWGVVGVGRVGLLDTLGDFMISGVDMGSRAANEAAIRKIRERLRSDECELHPGSTPFPPLRKEQSGSPP